VAPCDFLARYTSFSIFSKSCLIGITTGLDTSAICVSYPQNAPAWTTFLSPKSLPPSPPPTAYFLIFPCITGSFQGFFVLFLFDNFRNSGNIFPRIFCRDQFTPFLNRRTHIDQSAVKAQKNNLLATLSSMWQTEDSYFYENFYLKTF